MNQVTQPWCEDTDKILSDLESDRTAGLSSGEADRRREIYGSNTLETKQKTSGFDVLIRQFKSLIVLLLAAAATVAFSFGETIDGSAIVAVIILNAAIGFFTEIRAVRSMEALNSLGEVTARVRRDNDLIQIPAAAMVVGDLAAIEGGDIVSADMRIVSTSRLQVDESSLTGESMPVDKQTDPIRAETVLAERSNMLFKGTRIQRGSALAVVSATGMATELGAISSLVAQAEDETTPLEKRLKELGNRLIWITLSIAAAVAVIGIISGKETLLMIETAIALAVAAIPEGLPIVATIALARGMWRMARKNALINHLAAVETLGATSIICTDKTGTLTENRMTIKGLISAERSVDADQTDDLPASAREIIQTGVLCNNASSSTGDPMEIALLGLGQKAGIPRGDLLASYPVAGEEAFDSETKMMATRHIDGTRTLVAVKGAPEAVLSVCSSIQTQDGEREFSGKLRDEWITKNEELAEQGLRILAMASKKTAAEDDPVYENLTLHGFVTFLDPPREDVRPAILECRSAGIRVVMITGDQEATARAIGIQVGLEDPEKMKSVRGINWKEPAELSEKERAEVLDSVVFSRFNP
ncbi:MAG: HAD-IC family P-type ATPase, partial [Spirochaetales bacterium]|nr:HAD-IC family P-type ATPase [Spirochaetales bacterium]